MNYLLSDERLRQLSEQWEIEYEDVEMTDAEWEVKRWNLIAQAQLDYLAEQTDEEFREAVAKLFWEKAGSTYSYSAHKYIWEKAPAELKKFAYRDAAQICALSTARVQSAKNELTFELGKVVREETGKVVQKAQRDVYYDIHADLMSVTCKDNYDSMSKRVTQLIEKVRDKMSALKDSGVIIGKPDKLPAGGTGTTGPSGYKRGDTPGQGIDT